MTEPYGDPRPPRVLAVVNSASSGPRRLRGWLEDEGLSVVEHLGAEGLPDTLDNFDAVIFLGGGLMPDDDERAPWLTTERALARETIDRDLPALGVCLGAQLLALVAGGRVEAQSGQPERGSTMITATTQGAADQVTASLTGGAPMIENHQDRITELPASATLLATSAACPVQAFRIKTHVYGVQFHPECSSADVERWNPEELHRDGFDLTALIADARAADPANLVAARALVAAFAASVRQTLSESTLHPIATA